jgi:hypothetical protein
MSFFETIANIDRRVIFLFIAFAVIIPVLLSFSCTEEASPIVEAIFDKIESLPEGSKVLISFDYGPSTVPEVQPMIDALLRHCCEKNLRMYMMALWGTGHNLISESMVDIIEHEFPDKVYGVDYVNLGYKAGNQGLINVILTDMKKMYTTDAVGTEIDAVPMMVDIRNLKSFDLILSLGGGFPGVKEWVLFGGDPGNVPVAGGATAVSAPLLYPYYPRQLLGLMGGIKGAAEYESDLIKRYPKFRTYSHPGIDMMGPQTVAHIVIVIFIVIGNITFFVARKREGDEGRERGILK